MSQYASLQDLTTYGIQAIAVQNVPTADQTNQLIAASSLIDSYFNGRYALPLLQWDISVTMNAAYIAAYLLMSVRGFRPTQGSDDTVRKNYENAIAWCQGVQRQSVHPVVVQSAPVTDPTYQLPQVHSSVPRGWNTSGRFGGPEGV